MEHHGIAPEELIAFADEAAERRGASRSGLLAELLQAERVREQVGTYLDRYGWDVAEDGEAWREYQRHRMASEYAEDEWCDAAPRTNVGGR